MPKYTYQLLSKGYTIFCENGVVISCLEQTPFPADTWEESAQLHVASLIEEDAYREKLLEVAVLKDELQATDYKIIKCYEYQLAGLELPYDIAELHSERQAIRDQINALEGQATV